MIIVSVKKRVAQLRNKCHIDLIHIPQINSWASGQGVLFDQSFMVCTLGLEERNGFSENIEPCHISCVNFSFVIWLLSCLTKYHC